MVVVVVVVVVAVWQLSCRGSYHFLKRDYVADAVPLYQYTHWNWYSFRRPRKDDRLSQPPGVSIQRPIGLELRTLGSQAATLTTEPTPGYISKACNISWEMALISCLALRSSIHCWESRSSISSVE